MTDINTDHQHRPEISQKQTTRRLAIMFLTFDPQKPTSFYLPTTLYWKHSGLNPPTRIIAKPTPQMDTRSDTDLSICPSVCLSTTASVYGSSL